MKKIINKLREWMNFNPPTALSAGGWGKYRERFKTEAPIRHFIMETIPDFFRPLKWKMQHASEWVRFRVVRYHIVDTGLKPNYYECEQLILHSNFSILKDFVEVQKGWMYVICHDEVKLDWKERYIPFYRRVCFRNAELGLKYLEWETTLDSEDLSPQERIPEQAKKAREIIDLYNWWVNVRPNRKDIDLPDYDDQDMYMGCLNEDFDINAEDFQAQRKAWKYQEELEEKWHEEDEANLIRLIKIRRGLWT